MYTSSTFNKPPRHATLGPPGHAVPQMSRNKQTKNTGLCLFPTRSTRCCWWWWFWRLFSCCCCCCCCCGGGSGVRCLRRGHRCVLFFNHQPSTMVSHQSSTINQQPINQQPIKRQVSSIPACTNAHRGGTARRRRRRLQLQNKASTGKQFHTSTGKSHDCLIFTGVSPT